MLEPSAIDFLVAECKYYDNTHLLSREGEYIVVLNALEMPKEGYWWVRMSKHSRPGTYTFNKLIKSQN